MRMDSFVLNQTHKVQSGSIVAPILDQIPPFFRFENISGFQGIIYALQFLDHTIDDDLRLAGPGSLGEVLQLMEGSHRKPSRQNGMSRGLRVVHSSPHYKTKATVILTDRIA